MNLHYQFKDYLSLIISLFILLALPIKAFSQQYKLDNQTSELKIYGTSSLHDWSEDVEEQSGIIFIDLTNDLKVNKFNIEVIAESIKSGKKAMDKNTYKALKTDNYKTIVFRLTNTKSVSKLTDNTYNVTALGDLTIAGVTRGIELTFELMINNNNLEITGEKSFKMTQFNIEPPKALLGTIKTGDEVTLKFKTIFTK